MTILSVHRCLAVLFLLSLSACGREGPTRPPQDFAPRAVEQLKVSGGVDGVRFTWNSPTSDRRGKSLESLDGYQLLRAELSADQELRLDDLEFNQLTFLPDQSVATLLSAREEARNKGQLTRHVKVDPALSQFSFTDQNVRPGQVYFYRILPTNQGGIEGEAKNLVRVVYRGEASEVALLSQESLFDAEAGVAMDTESDE